jgi:hypothetical protein
MVNGLTGVGTVATKEYHNGKFDKENALDQFLVPYIYTASFLQLYNIGTYAC